MSARRRAAKYRLVVARLVILARLLEMKPFPYRVDKQLPFPDLALLKIETIDHPCVYLHPDVQPYDRLSAYGYPDEQPEGDSATFDCEGVSQGELTLLKFKFGEVRAGFSGAPLLNERTGGACGLENYSRNYKFDQGGRAIPTSVIFQELNGLEARQKQFHQQDGTWRGAVSMLQAQFLGGQVSASEQIGVKTERKLRVFLGCADDDKAKVKDIYRQLKTDGIKVWFRPEDTAIGEDERQEIQKKIPKSDAVILCFSKGSVNTKGVHNLESGTALEEFKQYSPGNIFLLPLRLEECDLPFEISKLKTVGLYEPDWYNQLLRALKKV